MTAGALMLYVAAGKTSKNLKIYEIPEMKASVLTKNELFIIVGTW
mgnify:CR=1 FL=1